MNSLVVLGTDHHLVEPSRFGGFSADDPAKDLTLLHRGGFIQGFIVLATCNRFEAYVDLGENGDEALRGCRRIFRGLPLFEERGVDAARHLIRVAAALESMVLGENQIHGQVKHAWQTSQEAGHCSCVLHETFRFALRGAREIRRRTGLGTQPVSVASLGAHELLERVRDIDGARRVAIVGAGTMAAKAAAALAKHDGVELCFVNRTLTRAQALADKHEGTAMSLRDFREAPPAVEALLLAIRTTAPVLDRRLADRLRGGRENHPRLVVVDVGVPATFAPELATRDDMEIVDMDRLRPLAERNAAEREAAAARALPIIETTVERLARRQQQRDLDLQGVRRAHLDLAQARARRLAKEFPRLSEGEQEKLERTLFQMAKAHAHLHLKDLKSLVPVS